MKTVIFQNLDFQKRITSQNLSKIFDRGSENSGSFPIQKGKYYKFELKLKTSSDETPYGNLFFGMIGNLANIDKVIYDSQSIDYIDWATSQPKKREYDSFESRNINDGIFFPKIKTFVSGIFKCVNDSYLTPAIAFDTENFDLTVHYGSYFKLTEIETSSDII